MNITNYTLKIFGTFMFAGFTFSLFVFCNIIFQSNELKNTFYKVMGIVARLATASLSLAWAFRWLYYQLLVFLYEAEAAATTISASQKTLTMDEATSLFITNLLLTVLGVILCTNLYFIFKYTALTSVKNKLEKEITAKAFKKAIRIALKGGFKSDYYTEIVYQKDKIYRIALNVIDSFSEL